VLDPIEAAIAKKDILRSSVLRKAIGNAERSLMWEKAMRGISELDGDIRLGVTVNPLTGGWTPVGLRRSDLDTHVSIRGASGDGKTNMVLHIIEQAVELGLSFTIIDKKADYIHLADRYADDDSLLVADMTDLHLHPFEAPPGYSQRKWNRDIATLFAEKQVLERSVNMMSGRANAIYEETGEAPSVYGLYESLLEHAPSRSDGDYHYFSHLMFMLGSLILAYPEVLACRRGNLCPDFFDRRTVIHVDNTDTHTQFILTYIWLWLFRYRKANALRGRNHRGHLFIIEEAQNFLPIKDPRKQMIEDMLIRESREFNIHIFTVAQQATMMNQTVLANSGTQIVCGVKSPLELRYERAALQLDRQLAEALPNLPPNQNIVSLPGSAERDVGGPVLIETPHVNVRKDVTLDEVREMMKGRRERLRSDRIEDGLRESVLNHANRIRKRQRKRQEPVKEEPKAGPPVKAEPTRNEPQRLKPQDIRFEGCHTEEASLLLQDIFKNPFSWDSQRYKRLGMSNTIYSQAVELLRREGWIEQEPAQIWKDPCTKANFLVPTRRFLTQIGRPWSGRGEYEHSYWLWRLGKRFNGQIEDGYTDVAAVVNGVNTAFEVEMPDSVQHAGENVQRDLQKGYEKVYVLHARKKEEGRRMVRGLKRSVKAKLGEIPENVEITDVWSLLEDGK
jgi:hypothetical protein